MSTPAFWRACCAALLAAGLLAFLRPASVGAQADGPIVVGAVNLEKVINGMTERTFREERLQEFINQRDAELQQLGQQFESARQQVELAPPGSDEYRRAIEEAQRLNLRAQLEKEFSEQLVAQRRAEVFTQLFNRIRDAAQRLAPQVGVDIIISSDASAALPEGNEGQVRSAMISRRVLYADDNVDLSDELLQMLNNEWAAGQGG